MAEPSRCVPLGLAPSFGFGDRIGLATPGHIEAMRRAGAGIAPIFAQQSIREMERTGRTAKQVMEDGFGTAWRMGYAGPMGGDADHLKTAFDIRYMKDCGFSLFTLDPSGLVETQADTYDMPALLARFATIETEIPWILDYMDRELILLPTGTVVRTNWVDWHRAAVKYGRALNYACAMGEWIRRSYQSDRPDDFEVELSVDETDRPTTLAEHFLIADRCRAQGLKLVSLAPRFIGEFEKGVDYKGDVAALEASLRDHAALAEMLGPYKLSLHSGSDKLSIYPALARATKGRYHVKTAGTSYLEALRVVALVAEPLFRRVVAFARERYDQDRATYHVSATLAGVPKPDELSHADLIRTYLGVWDEVPEGCGFTQPGRQILHCTFGSTLRDPMLGAAIRGTLANHQERYTEVLADHFARHLAALKAGWPLDPHPNPEAR